MHALPSRDLERRSKAQPVPQLVKDDRHKIEFALIRRPGNPEMPIGGAVKLGNDVVFVGSVQISAGEFFGERRRIVNI